VPDLTNLPPADVAARAGRLRKAFDSAAFDALLVTRLVNVRYLTGFTGSSAMLFVGPDRLVLSTDGRYRDQSAEQLAAHGVDADIEVGNADEQRIALATAGKDFGRIGLEAHGVTWAQQRAIAADWYPQSRLVPTNGLIEDLRRVKDVGEQARIAAACAIGDAALAAIRPLLAEGPEERELALALENEMRRLGASGTSFDTIVASGPNGAKPHASPSDRRLSSGDLVVLDFGCVVDGYCSDMTRTVAVGDPEAVPADLRRIHAVVLASHEAGKAAVRSGVTAGDVDRACRDVIADAGWADEFVHSTGHGVGLEIHEAPWVRTASGDTLATGHVVTVEPGVYLTGIGGVRIEDTGIVTDDGYRTLTESPRELTPA
jgi:Xaa-Pro aminopeptidase